jgi:hypothetical protein
VLKETLIVRKSTAPPPAVGDVDTFGRGR